METVQATGVSIIKSKFSVALNKVELGIQNLHNIEGKIVYNEDNLQEIADFITKCKKALGVVKAEFEILKEPIRREAANVDESNRFLNKEINDVMGKASAKYSQMCVAIEKRRKEYEIEKSRVEALRNEIGNNVLKFSERISNCVSESELLSVEKIINLEKTRKDKYRELLSEAIEKFNILNSLVKDQKYRIRELEALNKTAASETDEEKLVEIQEKTEMVENKIDEAKIIVQESAISSVTEDSIPVAEEIFPEVKPRRTQWTWEAVGRVEDIAKKMPSWVRMELNEEMIDEYLKTKRVEGIVPGAEEFTFAGIKFFLKKTY